MRKPAAEIWRNLILLYVGILLVMAAWGATDTAMARWVRPALAAAESPRRIPSLLELSGLRPPGVRAWRRMLQMGIPGLMPAGRRRLTSAPPWPRASAVS